MTKVANEIVDSLFRSGGRSVILPISKKTIPTTSVPPVNSYALAFALRLSRFILSFFFRFSAFVGFDGSSVSSDPSTPFSSVSSSSSSSSPSSNSRLSSFERASSSSLSSSGSKATVAASFWRMSSGLADRSELSARANCSWTSPETLSPFFFAPFLLDSSAYQRGYSESAKDSCFTCTQTHFLLGFSIGEDVFDSHIKFAKVVFSKTILVPANSFEKHAMSTIYWQVERNVPFRVEILADCWRRLLCISKIDDEELGKR